MGWVSCSVLLGGLVICQATRRHRKEKEEEHGKYRRRIIAFNFQVEVDVALQEEEEEETPKGNFWLLGFNLGRRDKQLVVF